MNVYIDLAYVNSRAFSRKLRDAVEKYIVDDETGIFKDVNKYQVGFIEGRDATQATADRTHFIAVYLIDEVETDQVSMIREIIKNLTNKIGEQI